MNLAFWSTVKYITNTFSVNALKADYFFITDGLVQKLKIKPGSNFVAVGSWFCQLFLIIIRIRRMIKQSS